ncbi:MAG: acylphosphatase [Ruminococcus sp.]|nr:acylphosphatase [Ruminococcus sp.]
MNQSNNMIRKRVVFYGWVQGVGFRYLARQAALKYGVSGWVRNEYDGSVSMEIQGLPLQIEQTLATINNGRYIRIERMDSRMIPVNENERSFTVRY